MIYLYIAVGGALGSVTRYALGAVVQHRADGVFPVGNVAYQCDGFLNARFRCAILLGVGYGDQ